MQDEACGLYGMTGMFFSTNASYVDPFPLEEEYNPSIPPAGEGAEEVEEDEDESVEPDEEEEEAPPGPLYPPALIKKLRTNAFESHRKAIKLQKVNEQKLWPLMW